MRGLYVGTLREVRRRAYDDLAVAFAWHENPGSHAPAESGTRMAMSITRNDSEKAVLKMRPR